MSWAVSVELFWEHVFWLNKVYGTIFISVSNILIITGHRKNRSPRWDSNPGPSVF